MASKLKDATLLRVVGSLWKLYPWWISAIVVLGTLSSLSEGIGMALLIPLLQNLDQKGHEFTPNGRLQTAFSRLSELAPPDKRLGFLISLIFAAIVIKSLLSYGNQFLLASVNARVGHQLRSRMFGQLLDVSYSFIERNEPGKLLNTVSVESWRTTEAFAALFALLVSVCTIPIFTALLVLISWKLTLVISISLAAVIVHCIPGNPSR